MVPAFRLQPWIALIRSDTVPSMAWDWSAASLYIWL